MYAVDGEMFHVEQILGSHLMLRSMALAVERERVGHAYIFSGGKGFGKKMLSWHFAKAILCNNPNRGLACGNCKSCKTCDSGNNPDLVFVQGQKDALNVGEIRDMIADLAVMPHGGHRRVYIIPNADKMNQQAQNALLLSLEDGPKHAIFMLLAEGFGGFLPTILSRCIGYKIPPLSTDAITQYLQNQGIPQNKAQIAASFSKGGMGRAKTLLNDEKFADIYTTTINLAQTISGMNVAELFTTAKELEEKKEYILDILDILQMFYRDELITFYNVDFLYKIHAITDAREKLQANCNFLITIEILLLKLGGEYIEKTYR